MKIALIALIPLLGAMLPPLTARASRSVTAGVAAAVTLASLLLLLIHAPAVSGGEVVRTAAEWVPQAGLSFSFMIDGLGLFFAALILGIGLLIILYARFYLGARDPVGRFYAYLLLFQGAMLGIVLSDNILLLVVFWELTSLSSFLLIGYWSHLPAGRQGARMALFVTAGGGLALLAGMLMLGGIAGSYELSVILTRGDLIRSSPLYVPMLVLVLLGAFSKSAQFPFHFWLPHAMAAPTPVSAYLHSATMVKAGVFLLARLWPALSGTDEWFVIVSLTGLVTMLVGAWIALFKDDLKAILAYSTVSHLGMMTMLLGFSTPLAVLAAVFHILNHATFKAALFMSAGIVDHETGTRDVRKLGGLMPLMPISAALALIATAAMAGIPLLNGFLSKEMMLEQAAAANLAGNGWIVAGLATLAALLSVAYSLRLAFRTYLGEARQEYGHPPHDPSPGLWLPVAALVVPVVLIGLLPALFAAPLVQRTAQAVIGATELPAYQFAIWHGLTPALAMSAVAMLGGLLLLAVLHQVERARLRMWRLEAKAVFDASVEAAVAGARRLTEGLHASSLPRDLSVITLVILAVGLTAFASGTHGAGGRAVQPTGIPALAAWGILVTACTGLVLAHHNRLLALILTSVIGLIVSLTFLQFSAPDLAMTQISVEVVATILLLLALNLLPKATPREPGLGRRLRDGAIAAAAGLGTAALAFAVMTRDFASISGYHLEQSKPGGGGTNVVNVILVDFRGIDTFGEIIVLCIAALAVHALLATALRGAAARRLEGMRLPAVSPDAHPLILVVATRVLLPLALTVGVFIFLRGHNQPGGGFIAGLVVAVALIMQYMASGYDWASARARLQPHTMLGAGVLIAALTGIGSWVFGRPFLTSTFGYFHLPIAGEVELASAIGFDLGVFLTVVGTVVLALSQLSQVEHRAEQTAPRDGLPAPGPRSSAAPVGVPASPAYRRED